MKCYITLAALAAITPGVFAMTINTPTSVVECQPQLLSWEGGTAPYYLTIIPGGQPSATPLKSFSPTSANSMTWTVDIPGGTDVTFALKDSTGATSYTDTAKIQQNPAGCSSGGGGAAPAAAPAPAPAQDPAVATPQAADTTDNSSAAVSDNSGASSTAAAASGGASAASAASTRAATAPAGATTSAARSGSTAVAPAATTARASASVVAAASASASRAATGATSGAGARYSVTGLGFAGLFGLVGAMFL